MLTENDLQDMEMRADAATPGPWRASKGKWADWQWGTIEGEGMDGAGEVLPCVASVVRDPASDGDHNWDILARREDLQDYVISHDEGTANADFMAHARTDIPALIAEVRRLRTHLDKRHHCPLGQDWLPLPEDMTDAD